MRGGNIVAPIHSRDNENGVRLEKVRLNPGVISVVRLFMSTCDVVVVGSSNMDMVVRCSELPVPGQTMLGTDSTLR